MSRVGRALGVLLVGSMALVGCGGGDGDEAATTATTAGGSSSNEGGSGGTGDGTGTVTSAKCLEAATAMATAAGGLSAAFGGSSGDLTGSVEAFEAFAAVAPSEIKDDLQTVAEGYADFVRVMADTDFNPASGQAPSPETMARLEAASEKLADSDFEAAADRVSAWFEDECGE